MKNLAYYQLLLFGSTDADWMSGDPMAWEKSIWMGYKYNIHVMIRTEVLDGLKSLSITNSTL